MAGVILTIMMGGSVMLMKRGRDLHRWAAVTGDLNSRAARGVSRINRTLLGCGFDALTPDLTTPAGADTVWSSTLDLQLGDDWDSDNDVVIWGNSTRIQLELEPSEIDNGADDDGDGLVDEHRVVLIRNFGAADEQQVVLVNGVSEFLEGETFNGLDDNGNGMVDEEGLCFSLDGSVLSVQLTLQRLGPDGSTVTRTQGTTIGLRN